MEGTDTTPTLTARAKSALGSTSAWANFFGWTLFCVILLTLARNGVGLSRLVSQFHAGTISHIQLTGAVIGLGFTSLWIVVANGLLGWFALRYGSALESVKIMERPDVSNVTRAFGAQHGFWRLQGIMMIIALALIVAAVLMVIVVALLHR
ncbi:MAG: hypothetical protein ACRES7_11920 [Gammaproteobacteria bacterium]